MSLSTDSNCDADIFYKVKKEILDKLDLILQKVNLQIINSMDFQYQSKNTTNRKTKNNEDFTFIQLSHFESEISSLFDYLDKLYQSLNSSVSGYASLGNNTHGTVTELNLVIEKLENDNKKLVYQNSQIKKSFQDRITKYEQKLFNLSQTQKKLKQKLFQLSNQLQRQPQQISLLKKYIIGKLKQYKFQMLQARVQILSVIKSYELGNKQEQVKKNKQKEREREKMEIVCHHVGHSQMQIINQINQILKMC